MLFKVLALCLVLGMCLGIPVEKNKESVPVPLEVPPPEHLQKGTDWIGTGSPVKTPPTADNSDLKTDPSTWWYNTWYHTYPAYYYYHPRPIYTYWDTYYY